MHIAELSMLLISRFILDLSFFLAPRPENLLRASCFSEEAMGNRQWEAHATDIPKQQYSLADGLLLAAADLTIYHYGGFQRNDAKPKQFYQ